jgi:NAD(P)-dependent dehydrogenase (short-subunit alcohol dehydrogenase family)
MAGRLDGKVAMITGAASGIGLRAVELFIAEGAHVVAADLQDEKGAILCARFPGKLSFARCNVMEELQIAAAIAQTSAEFGGLDILFNNAGATDRMNTIGDLTVDGWNSIFDVLLRGPALAMKHAAPLMQDRGGGSIINTASVAGLQAGFGPLAYSTAKAGLIHMSRVAAAELSAHKIRVNAISPGVIATSIFGVAIGLPIFAADEMAKRIAENAENVQPLRRAGLPEDIAQTALFLASDAAQFVTGANIIVDGGITVGGRHSWDQTVESPLAALLRS